jgi:hypothetical protein
MWMMDSDLVTCAQLDGLNDQSHCSVLWVGEFEGNHTPRAVIGGACLPAGQTVRRHRRTRADDAVAMHHHSRANHHRVVGHVPT